MHNDLPTAYTCMKCGETGTDRDPAKMFWCSGCRKNYCSEYPQARRAHVSEHSTLFLQKMDVPPAYQECTFENFNAVTVDQKNLLRKVKTLDLDDTVGLYLFGPVGTGKTHLAIATLLAFRAEGYAGRFVSIQELLIKCRSSFRGTGDGLESVLEPCRDVSVLLLDDLGTEKVTDFTRETAGTLIDRAYRDCQQLIVTSNLDLKQLAERLDARIADRLIEMCQAVRSTGTSYRQKLAADRSSAMRISLASERIQ